MSTDLHETTIDTLTIDTPKGEVKIQFSESREDETKLDEIRRRLKPLLVDILRYSGETDKPSVQEYEIPSASEILDSLSDGELKSYVGEVAQPTTEHSEPKPGDDIVQLLFPTARLIVEDELIEP